MTTCAFCGRQNDPNSVFCADCGKPLKAGSSVPARPPVAAPATPLAKGAPQAGAQPVATRTVPTPSPATGVPMPDLSPTASCPACQSTVNPVFPFCPFCGTRLSSRALGNACTRCGTPAPPKARYCAACGTALGEAAISPPVAKQRSGEYLLAELDEGGKVLRKHELYTPDTTVGREDADIRFPDDPYLSPIHAKLSFENDRLLVRDLGSRNGTWVFLEEPYRLQDGDLLLIGSQMIRFRRLGYPGPFTPDADATRRMGSLIPSADIASLTQLRSDGSARDVVHLSPGRDVSIGREASEWSFSYDPSMSGAHATIRSEDADFVVIDRGSRNGVAIAARGEMVITKGSRVLVGDKLLRVEVL